MDQTKLCAGLAQFFDFFYKADFFFEYVKGLCVIVLSRECLIQHALAASSRGLKVLQVRTALIIS